MHRGETEQKQAQPTRGLGIFEILAASDIAARVAVAAALTYQRKGSSRADARKQHGTGVHLSVCNVRLDEEGKLHQRLMPAEVTGFHGDRRRDARLLNAHLGSDRNLAQ